MSIITIINNLLEIKIVQWALLCIAVVFIGTTVYFGLRVKWQALELKIAKSDLAWVQGALNLQNEAVKRANEQRKQLEQQTQIKAKEAATAKATAAARAAEILKLKLSKDCGEVAKWGVEQGLQQSHW